MFRNTLFDTRPAVIHGHGRHQFKPHWKEILSTYREREALVLTCPAELTVVTCNNGHGAMGLLEESCRRAGLSYRICGQGREPWINSRDKPESLVEVLAEVTTPYVLYADSRDAIVVGSLEAALESFRTEFPGCRLLFGADRINWPYLREFKKFEEKIAPGHARDGFVYLNGGAWIGEREYTLGFFQEALKTEPVAQAVDSEQGVLKKLLATRYPEVQLDYKSVIIQNLGFVTTPVLELDVN